MNLQEQLEHEAIKSMLKLIISNNTQLSNEQKQIAMNNVEMASHQADWLVEILKTCGYLK